jgi:hypothetical protein
MKTYLRLIILFAVAAAALLVMYLVRQATEPQSAIIARERDRVYAARDGDRMKNDAVYAAKVEDTLALLDYRLAVACNAENKPDRAIDILQRLIGDEEAKEKGGIPRRSRSYLQEANYYEALKESFALTHDEAGVNKALDRYTQLMTKAMESRKLESREEGRSVGSPAD